MTLRISMLGPLVIDVDGDRPTLPRKARALVAYLAMRNAHTDRDAIADLLWPLTRDSAQHGLRNCLWGMRQTSFRPHIGCDYRNCWLRDFSTDVETLAMAALSQNFGDAEAVAYRGEFLEGFSVPSEPFEDWLRGERARIRALICDLLLRLGEHHNAAGDHGAAIAAARRLLAIDQLEERAHALLMRAYHGAGQRSAALRQFKECETIMMRELGVAPDERTRMLAYAMRQVG